MRFTIEVDGDRVSILSSEDCIRVFQIALAIEHFKPGLEQFGQQWRIEVHGDWRAIFSVIENAGSRNRGDATGEWTEVTS